MSRFCAICVSTEKYYKCTVTENTGIDSGNGSGKQQKRTHKPRDAYWNNSGVTNNHGECEITPKNDSFRVSHKHPMAKSAFPRFFPRVSAFSAITPNSATRGKSRSLAVEMRAEAGGYIFSSFDYLTYHIHSYCIATSSSRSCRM